MTPLSTPRRMGAVLLATIVMALSGSMAWATVSDYGARGRVPQGVSVAGTELGGMTEADARATLEQAVSGPLLRPIDVEVDGSTFTFDPKGSVTVDVDGMLDAAYAARRQASFVSRVRHDLGLAELQSDVPPMYSVDSTAIASWLGTAAKKVNRPAVDATITVSETSVTISKSATGRKTLVSKGVKAIKSALEDDKALSGGERSVKVPVKVLKPKVTEDSFGKTIVVDLSDRRIRLFNGAKLEKMYRCAIGTPSHPTPTGHFQIELKRYMPTWINPAPNGWGKDMPRVIGPGPSNPLGTRALNLTAPGIRFHGTTNIGSVGTAASHGCMRMVRADIEDLYERVEVGTQVYILP